MTAPADYIRAAAVKGSTGSTPGPGEAASTVLTDALAAAGVDASADPDQQAADWLAAVPQVAAVIAGWLQQANGGSQSAPPPGRAG